MLRNAIDAKGSKIDKKLKMVELQLKKLKIDNIINTNVHLQNANEIGGTYSTPPLATIKLLAIKIG